MRGAALALSATVEEKSSVKPARALKKLSQFVIEAETR